MQGAIYHSGAGARADPRFCRASFQLGQGVVDRAVSGHLSSLRSAATLRGPPLELVGQARLGLDGVDRLDMRSKSSNAEVLADSVPPRFDARLLAQRALAQLDVLTRASSALSAAVSWST